MCGNVGLAGDVKITVSLRDLEAMQKEMQDILKELKMIRSETG